MGPKSKFLTFGDLKIDPRGQILIAMYFTPYDVRIDMLHDHVLKTLIFDPLGAPPPGPTPRGQIKISKGACTPYTTGLPLPSFKFLYLML